MKLLIFIFLILSIKSYSHVNMRKCLLLPVLDRGKENMAFSIFKDVETYLKNSNWCFYKSNSEILNILQDFKNNLNQGLKNKDVLKLVAEKTTTGSLIRIHIENLVNGINLNLDVIGSSGDDLYFRRETDFNVRDTAAIAQTIKQWLSTYAKEIPYDGRITGVLGDQFTVDIGTRYGFSQEDEIIVKRLLKKRQHPLLKEVIDWESELIAKGRILHTTETQSQGKILEYTTKKQIQIGDWVNIVRKKEKGPRDDSYFKNNDYKYGKLGYFQLLFSMGTGLARPNPAGDVTKKISGLNFGGNAKVELWATRHIISSFTLGKHFGNYKKQTEEVRDNSVDESHLSAVIGYKYLPLGFFYGPQINTYIGYMRNAYSFDTQKGDGLTEFRFQGLLLGVKGDIPIVKSIRASLEFGFILRPGFEEDVNIYGEADSSSHTFISLGGDYSYRPNLVLNILLGTSTSEAKFVGPTRAIKIQKKFFRLGTSYNF